MTIATGDDQQSAEQRFMKLRESLFTDVLNGVELDPEKYLFLSPTSEDFEHEYSGQICSDDGGCDVPVEPYVGVIAAAAGDSTAESGFRPGGLDGENI